MRVGGRWSAGLRPLIPVVAVANLAMKPDGKREMIRSSELSVSASTSRGTSPSLGLDLSDGGISFTSTFVRPAMMHANGRPGKGSSPPDQSDLET